MLAKRLILTLVLALSLILALLRLMTSLSVDLPLAHAADHTVCLAGPPTCTYTNVQAAVDAAAPGDVIKVAAGTYTGVSARRSGFGNPVFITQTVYISKNLTIRGGYTTAFTEPPDPQVSPTILDAQGQGRVLVTVGVSPIIEGLKLIHGNANVAGTPLGSSPAYFGGGVFVLGERPVFSGNIMFDNKADQGGGVYVFSGAATLNNNVVVSNTASTYGGGVGVVSGTVFMNYNQLLSNTAFYGGGFYGYGTLNANLFRTNTANYGGGLYSVFSTLINNIIADNQAAITGSGLYLTGPSSLSHNTFVHNSGAEGSAIYVASYYSTSSNAVLTNTIIASQTVGIIVTAGNTATLNSTLWSGNSANWGGGGTISSGNNYVGSPLFIDSNSGNYHIGPTSAAIDKGVDAGVITDIDGQPRPQGVGFDLGADEGTATPFLSISKSGPVTAMPSDFITYTLTVTNSGSLTATNLVITDNIPLGASYVSGGTKVGQVVSWTVLILAAGGVTQTSFIITATQTITNSNYGVQADSGYTAQGNLAVVTEVSAQAPEQNIFLPIILKQ